MRWVHASVLALGVAVFAILVQRVGLDTLWRDAARLGWGVVAIVAVEGVSDLLRTAAWQRCFHRAHRPGLLRMWWPNLAGAAVNYVTPTATIGGEVVRGTLAPRGIPATEVTSSLAINRLTLSVADAAIALAGAAVVMARMPLGLAARLGVVAGIGLLVAGTGAFLWLQRSGRMAGLVGRRSALARLLGAERAARVRRVSEEIDTRMAAVHREELGALLGSAALQLAARFVGALQLWIFLAWMGAPSGAGTVLTVFLVARAIEAVAFFVPASLGTQEGGFMLGISLAGLEPSLGLLFSLALRVEQLTWTAIGFAAYGALVWQRRREEVGAARGDLVRRP